MKRAEKEELWNKMYCNPVWPAVRPFTSITDVRILYNTTTSPAPRGAARSDRPAPDRPAPHGFHPTDPPPPCHQPQPCPAPGRRRTGGGRWETLSLSKVPHAYCHCHCHCRAALHCLRVLDSFPPRCSAAGACTADLSLQMPLTPPPHTALGGTAPTDPPAAMYIR